MTMKVYEGWVDDGDFYVTVLKNKGPEKKTVTMRPFNAPPYERELSVIASDAETVCTMNEIVPRYGAHVRITVEVLEEPQT